jgi:outer membrane protein assembly factor BamB
MPVGRFGPSRSGNIHELAQLTVRAPGRTAATSLRALAYVRANRRGRRLIGVSGVGLFLVAVALLFALPVGLAGAGSGGAGPPPEWAANPGGWPSHNLDLSNTRADFDTRIDARDVATLKPRWTFSLHGGGIFGVFTSNPIVLGGVVYFEDSDSAVFALRLSTGKLVWQHDYHSLTPSGGPNGVAYGYGLLYGETEDSLFALNPDSGRQIWIRKLTSSAQEGIDMAPQLYDGKVLISTIPGNAASFYYAGAYGVVYALDARTGKVVWSFSTVKGGAKLWGDPEQNGGGGLWYPPAVDSQGRLFIGVANPSPYPPTASDPDARSRPGPNLYTDSLVALDGANGKLLWYQQVTPHDLRDYDFQDSPIVVTMPVHGVRTEIVIGAGKSGQVIAFNAADGKRLWSLAIGKHNKYEFGPLPTTPVVYCPGSLGGVLTPMAEARGVVFVPWIDVCFKGSATGLAAGGPHTTTGGLAAVNAATGAIIWKRTLPDIDSGAATVANDVVFTSTYNGTIYAFSTKSGATLWATKAPYGINSFPAITRTMLIVGASAPATLKSFKTKTTRGEIVAYALPR